MCDCVARGRRKCRYSAVSVIHSWSSLISSSTSSASSASIIGTGARVPPSDSRYHNNRTDQFRRFHGGREKHWFRCATQKVSDRRTNQTILASAGSANCVGRCFVVLCSFIRDVRCHCECNVRNLRKKLLLWCTVIVV